MFERFDEAARLAVSNAAHLAIGEGARKVDAAHLCRGALLANDGLVALLGADPSALVGKIEGAPGEGQAKWGEDALAVTNDLAARPGEISTRDLLVASLDHGGASALRELGIDEADARRKLGAS